jgi:hypothetical protein
MIPSTLCLWSFFVLVMIMFVIVHVENEEFDDYTTICRSIVARPFNLDTRSTDTDVFRPSTQRVSFMIENTTADNFNPFYRYFLTTKGRYVAPTNVPIENDELNSEQWWVVPTTPQESVKLKNTYFYVANQSKTHWWKVDGDTLTLSNDPSSRSQFNFVSKYGGLDNKEVSTSTTNREKQKTSWVYIYHNNMKLWSVADQSKLFSDENKAVVAENAPNVIQAKYRGTYVLNFF